MVHTVLVPVDGSERSWEALDVAAEMFGESDVTVIHVVNPVEGAVVGDAFGEFYVPDADERSRGRAEGLRAEARERAEAAGLDPGAFDTVIDTGRPAQAIVSYLENHDVDHVVMGSRGRTGIKRILLGSVAENVVRRSPVPVTVVR